MSDQIQIGAVPLQTGTGQKIATMTAGNGAVAEKNEEEKENGALASSVSTKEEVRAEKGKSIASAEPVEEFVQRYASFKKREAPAIEEDEIKKVFEFFDENKDGLISKDDLRVFMSKLGFNTTEDEISSMVSSVDINGDGSVDFSEFSSLYQTLSCEDLSNGCLEQEEEVLKEAFDVFDKNGDGSISPTELQTVLVNLGMNEGRSLSNCERMIHNVDADGNGEVDFVEFKKLMGADFGRG